MKKDYSKITEAIDVKINRDQLYRLTHRYNWIINFCKNKDVLEIGCGNGAGNKLIRENSKSFVATEYSKKNILLAKKYGVDDKIVYLNANKNFTFKKKFDVIIFLEGIYYLKNIQNFLLTAKNNLKMNGVILLTFPNKKCLTFNKSLYSTFYPTFDDLNKISKKINLECKSFCFSEIKFNFYNFFFIFLKKIIIYLKLTPNTQKTKALIKKFFFKEKMISFPKNIKKINYQNKLKKMNLGLDYKNYRVIYSILKKNNK